VGDRHSATHDIHCNFLGKGALDDLFASGKGAVRIDRLLPQYRIIRMMKQKTADAVRYRDGILARFESHLPKRRAEFSSVGITGVRTFVLEPMDGGDELYLGFVREGESNGSDGVTEVKLTSKMKVRDMRKKTDLGAMRSFKVRLQPYEAAFYRVEEE
jgi:hypothetical protein